MYIRIVSKRCRVIDSIILIASHSVSCFACQMWMWYMFRRQSSRIASNLWILQELYIWRLGTKNRGHISGLHGWSSALGCRLWVQAPGHGSFSPVATFKLCSWQTWTRVNPSVPPFCESYCTKRNVKSFCTQEVILHNGSQTGTLNNQTHTVLPILLLSFLHCNILHRTTATSKHRQNTETDTRKMLLQSWSPWP